ncbi:MAG: cell division protein FtsZ [Candidatus Kapaibacteriales bacterium]
MPISLASEASTSGAVIKVIGVGGGGGNAVNNMVSRGLQGVEFLVANTDIQALENSKASVKIQLGRETTKGLGAGADPMRGRESVEESENEIKEYIKGSDMLFVTAGMGGGTGTGGAPNIARLGKQMGSLVVGIVTKPFPFEGKKRNAVAEEWVKELKQNVDALIVIPNARLLEIIDSKTSFAEAFAIVDEVLYNATRGISEIINQSGYINVDFADVKTVMQNMGEAIMGIGVASGDNRAVEATTKALNSPLLDGVSIEGAKGVLVNIKGSTDMGMLEISEAVNLIEEQAGANANIIQGIVHDDSMGDEMMVTVVATGFDAIEEEEEKEEEQARSPRGGSIFDTFGMPKSNAKPKGEYKLDDLKKPAFLRNTSEKSTPLGNMHLEKMAQQQRKTPTSSYHNTKSLGKNLSGSFKMSSELDKPAFIRRILEQ